MIYHITSALLAVSFLASGINVLAESVDIHLESLYGIQGDITPTVVERVEAGLPNGTELYWRSLNLWATPVDGDRPPITAAPPSPLSEVTTALFIGLTGILLIIRRRRNL